MMLTEASVTHALQQIPNPDSDSGQDWLSAGYVKNLRLVGAVVTLDIELPYPAKSQVAVWRTQALAALLPLGVRELLANVRLRVAAHAVQPGVKVLSSVKNIIAVASGKGGVGKSTTAANLALALAAEGARVGVLDADIYGPSQPLMFGLQGQQPRVLDGKEVEPLVNYGVQVNSIGFLLDADQPVVWRGPLVVQALTQLLEQTLWDELDYLLIDMPPGTGDVPLTLAQKVPVTGVVIVTTPQDLALLDARRGYKMFDKVGIATLGIIENMALHVCSACGHAEPVFGTGGGQRLAEQYGLRFLGSLPLALHIREEADAGRPTVVAQPDSAAAQSYLRMARQLALAVAHKAKDYSAKMPTIKISST
jgi:ATP-binding protein involved in chromosome partitioning